MSSSVENPYVAIVARKHRNLKKKLEKILKLEANIATGKTLDEEQLILYSSKAAVEKAIADIGGLKEQLEEVYVQECATVEATKAAAATVNVTEASTETLSIQQSSSSTQCEDKPKVEVTEVASQIEHRIPSPPAVDPLTLELAARKILKVFHVCLKYSSITGNELPANVDFFGKTLLGQTSFASFDVALESSLRTLGTYLNEDLAPHTEFARGYTHKDICDFVDGLAYEMSASAVTNTFSSLFMSPPPANTAAVMSLVDSPVEQLLQEEEVPEEEQEEEIRMPPAPVSGPPAAAPPAVVRREEPTAAVRDSKEPKHRTPRERLREPVPAADDSQQPATEQTRAPRTRTRKTKTDGAPATQEVPLHGADKKSAAAPSHAGATDKDHRPRTVGADSHATARSNDEAGKQRGPRPARESNTAPVAAAVAESTTAAEGSGEEKRKRAPRVKKPKVHSEETAAVTQAAASATHSSPAPAVAKVWGGDNRIKDAHAGSSNNDRKADGTRGPAKVATPAKSAEGPAPTAVAGSSSGAPKPRPVVHNVAHGDNRLSADRPAVRRERPEGGDRPPRAKPAEGGASSAPRGPPREPRTTSSGPAPAASGGRPHSDRPPASAAPRAPRPPAPVASGKPPATAPNSSKSPAPVKK